MENWIETFGRYYKLGAALYKFYNGHDLSMEEIKLIAESSSDEKLFAMKVNTIERLKNKTDNSLTTFEKNESAVKAVKSLETKVK